MTFQSMRCCQKHRSFIFVSLIMMTFNVESKKINFYVGNASSIISDIMSMGHLYAKISRFISILSSETMDQ